MKDLRTITQKLRDCQNDPMWANHAEIPKLWCKQAADEIERLEALVDTLEYHVQWYVERDAGEGQ